jgi:DNA-binding transcriptional LysR family regulator
MDRFQAMQVFVRVVDSRSFSKAAETLELQRPSVTNMVKNWNRSRISVIPIGSVQLDLL